MKPHYATEEYDTDGKPRTLPRNVHLCGACRPGWRRVKARYRQKFTKMIYLCLKHADKIGLIW